MARGKLTGRRRVYRLNNMTGGMNTMSEDNAYLTFDPQANYGAALTQIPFEFKKIENWLPINRGGLSKTFGYTEYFDTGSSTPVRAIGRFLKSDGTNRFVYSQGTNAYSLSGGVSTSLGTTLQNDYQHYETALDKYIICDGTNIPKVYDGSTVSDLASGGDGTAATGFQQTLFYQNRVWGFSATHDQSLLYASDVGVTNAGYSSNFVNCDQNDGQKITAIAKFFIPGQLEPIIIVGKERSVGIVTGDGFSGSNPYTFTKISQDLGIPGFRQIVQFNLDAAFLSQRGIASYTTAVQNQNILQALLTAKVFDQFSALTTTYLPDALSWFDWKNRRISFAVAEGTSQYPNAIWHYDIDIRCMYRQTGFNVTAAFVDTDGTVYTGTDDGKILKHDATVFAYDGGAINASLKTPPLDFFEPYYYKRIVGGKIKVRGNGDYSLGISTTLNNDSIVNTTHTVPITAGKYTWGGGVWTDDPDVYQWGGAPLKFLKFYPGGVFENISFELTQSGANQPIDFLEMVLEVEFLDLI